MKLSTVLFCLELHAVFCLVPYLSPLCQQVGALESVLLHFDRNLKNETVLAFFSSNGYEYSGLSKDM